MAEQPVSAGPRVVLVDDDPTVARFVVRLLATKGITVEHLGTRAEIDGLVQRAANEAIDVILLDVDLADLSGLDVLAALRRQGVPTAVVMLTGDDRAATATAALRGGAFHYVVKSQMEGIEEVIANAARQTAVTRMAQAGPDEGNSRDTLVGASASMSRLRRMLPQIARTSASVLVAGESGTGKELVARTLHELSPRSARAFVPLNCGALPEGLIDSELFGHTKGAFTGAISARPGVFVQADGGTLFLDEIGDMPLAVQARLLRTLQEGEVRPVGGDVTRQVDVRVVAATHVDLARAVQDGRFRADLYFRLNVVNLIVPPLRERVEDLPALVSSLLRRHEAKVTVHPDTYEVLARYGWPGNVRELENALLHALALSTADVLEPVGLPVTVLAGTRFAPDRVALGSAVARLDGNVGELGDDLPLTEAKRRAALEFERAYLLRILEQSKGIIAAAARAAGIDRTNFRRLLQRHNIDSSRFKE